METQLAFYGLKAYNTKTKLNIFETTFTFSDNKLLNFLPKERCIEPARLRFTENKSVLLDINDFWVFEMDFIVNDNNSVLLTLNPVERRNFEIGISNTIYCLQLKANAGFP